MSKTHIASTAVSYTSSLRITISLSSGKVEVLKAARVAMRVMAPPPSPPSENGAGYWFEVRDKDGNLLYHRPLPHSDLSSIEVFDDPKGGTIRRVTVPESERKIDLIIPDFPNAVEFTLHGPEPKAKRKRPSKVLDRRLFEQLRAVARGQAEPGGESTKPDGGAR